MGHPPALASAESASAGGDWRFSALHRKVHNLQALLERRASMLTLMSLVVRTAHTVMILHCNALLLFVYLFVYLFVCLFVYLFTVCVLACACLSGGWCVVVESS
jgi:hypothetical protein